MTAIRGFLETSLLEWDGRITAVAFLGGCNFRCPFCHVPDLVRCDDSLPILSFEDIRTSLSEQGGWLDGVVISGGEPTLDLSLGRLLEKLHSLGMLTRVNTNGSRPAILRQLIDARLVDSVAMDVKTSLVPERYHKAAGVDVDLAAIEESIDLLLASDIEAAFRTTIAPGFVTADDVASIAARLGEGAMYGLQQFASENCMDASCRELKPYSRDEVAAIRQAARAFIPSVKLRGIELD